MCLRVVCWEVGIVTSILNCGFCLTSYVSLERSARLTKSNYFRFGKSLKFFLFRIPYGLSHSSPEFQRWPPPFPLCFFLIPLAWNTLYSSTYSTPIKYAEWACSKLSMVFQQCWFGPPAKNSCQVTLVWVYTDIYCLYQNKKRFS